MRAPRLAVLAAGCLLLLACGDSSDDSSESAAPTTQSPAAAAVTSAPPATQPPATEAVTTDPVTTAAPVTTAPATGAAGGGGGAVITSACGLLTVEDLRNNPFFVDEPTPEGNDYGAGFLDCVWTGDFEEHEVIVSILPKASYDEDFAGAVPLDAHGDDIGGGELFDDLMGIGRLGRGTTAVYVAGDQVIMVAVRTGEEGTLASDRVFAVNLGKLILTRI